MMGTTAQLVALVCHFNARQRGKAATFSANHSTATFCEYIHFLQHSDQTPANDAWNIVARTSEEWIEQQSSRGRRAWLLHRAVNSSAMSDRMSAGFVGGGREWLIALAAGSSSDLWATNWQVGNQQAADQRIWQVRYAMIAENVPFSPPQSRPINSIRDSLNSALQEIAAFASKHQLSGFADAFAKGSACLTATDPLALVFHKDLAPADCLPLAATQLLATSQAAWVFGGMGSWNDQWFAGADGEEYERLSETLFALLNESICAAAHSTIIDSV